jgi:NADH-quinone oxidoreductase subunit G
VSDIKTGQGGKPVPGAPTGSTVPESQPGAPPSPPPGIPHRAQPKHPGMVTLTVDGKEVTVKPGTNMIEAAKQVRVEIPYYCYHPRLSIAANCRMCLVEVSPGPPKLTPACQTAIAEGQVVRTNTPRVQEQQRAVMEFLLQNHPVDCAICDQAGECKLQDYYMRYDYRPSRLEGTKILRDKRKVLGPLVVLDQERCVLCTRCVRFMSEVAKEPQLGVFGRGAHEVIDVFPGAQLDSNYSGNTVDICPVGALLNRDFRFRARAWFLSAAPSVCTGCSRGCSTFVDFFAQDTYRYRPRENERINKSWMCDQGRLSYKYLNSGRVVRAFEGRGADRQEISREEALKKVAGKLQPLAGQGRIAVLASPLASNEDLLATLTFASETLGATMVYVGGRPDGEGDDFLMTPDKNPNRRGLEWIARGLGLALRPFDALIPALRGGEVKALYAVGTEVPGDPAELIESLRSVELLVAQATNESPLTAQAHVLLPAAVHTEDEGTFVNVDGILQRFRKAYPPRGDSQPHWQWSADLLRAFGKVASYASSRDVFLQLSPRVPELASFPWDKEAPLGTPKGIHLMPAAADGRPPGYREFGVPRVRGI